MAVFQFGKFKTEFDATGYDFSKNLEALSQELSESIRRDIQEATMPYSEIVKRYHELHVAFYDKLFGAGSGEKILAAVSVRECDKATDALLSAVRADREEHVAEAKQTVAKYSAKQPAKAKTKK